MRALVVAFGLGSLVSVTGCAHNRIQPEQRPTITAITTVRGDSESYAPVPVKAAIILGCTKAPGLPICEVTPPNSEEDSAFRADAARLRSHYDARCRELGSAIEQNRAEIRMYRKALVVDSGNGRMYGVGHTYSLEDKIGRASCRERGGHA